MTFRLTALLLLFTAASPDVHYFHFDRPVQNTPQQNQQTCLTLDPATFTHAGPHLSSLRLYRADTEAPYALNYAAPARPSTKNIPPMNAGIRNRAASFDAVMPDSTYSDITLNIDATNFIATVRVSGSAAQSGAPITSLGSFTIFDFTRQKLGRSTILHLPKSDFRYLHFRIDGHIRPDQITGISAGQLPANAPQYITVANSSSVRQKDRDSIIEFSLPANIPVDQILFAPGAQPVNFSREVTLQVNAPPSRPATDEEEPPQPTFSSGNLLRIHSVQDGRRIDEEHLAIAAPEFLPNGATRWTITIHNQDDPPLALASVSLQMIARTLCFDAQPGADYTLYYGDAALAAPHYDYADLFSPQKTAAHATLGPEQQNPRFQPRPDQRPLTEKHPALLWIALLAAILLLGAIALRTGRQMPRP